MVRRLSVLAAVLLLTQAGCCCSRCGHRGQLTANGGACAPCQTAGRGAGCFDAVTGQPISCPGEIGATVMPNPSFPNTNPRLEELPPPSGLIPGQAIPIPAPAPPSGDASLPFPSLPGTPVKSGQK